MVRHARSWLVLVVALFGCASRGTPMATSAPQPRPSELATEEQKLMACLDLRDHIVALYADDYEEQQGLDMSTNERDAFRRGWAEELAKKGTFESFEESCFFSLTPRKYKCGMESQTTDGLVACMRLTSR